MKDSGIWQSVKGFTLIEILVVMVIIGILATIMAGSFGGTRLKARDARRKNDLQQLQRAFEAYHNDFDRYPASDAGGLIVENSSSVPWGGIFKDTSVTDGTVYMAIVPTDPRSPTQEYFYVASTNGQRYQLYTRLENELDPTIPTTALPSYECGVGLNCNWGVSSPNADIFDDDLDN